MSILDDLNALTPTRYHISRVTFEQSDDGIIAHWDVRVYNEDGMELSTLHPASQPDSALLSALVTWYQNSKSQFETATGLTEYVKKEIDVSE